MYLRAGAVWILLLIVAVANGAFREAFLTPAFGAHAGHIASTSMLSLAIFVVSWLSMSWIGPKTERQAIAVGVQWLVLTVAFEILAGRFMFGNTWERLLSDYDLLRGRIWVLVLLANLVSPVWVFRRTRPI